MEGRPIITLIDAYTPNNGFGFAGDCAGTVDADQENVDIDANDCFGVVSDVIQFAGKQEAARGTV